MSFNAYYPLIEQKQLIKVGLDDRFDTQMNQKGISVSPRIALMSDWEHITILGNMCRSMDLSLLMIQPRRSEEK